MRSGSLRPELHLPIAQNAVPCSLLCLSLLFPEHFVIVRSLGRRKGMPEAAVLPCRHTFHRKCGLKSPSAGTDVIPRKLLMPAPTPVILPAAAPSSFTAHLSATFAPARGAGASSRGSGATRTTAARSAGRFSTKGRRQPKRRRPGRDRLRCRRSLRFRPPLLLLRQPAGLPRRRVESERVRGGLRPPPRPPPPAAADRAKKTCCASVGFKTAPPPHGGASSVAYITPARRWSALRRVRTRRAYCPACFGQRRFSLCLCCVHHAARRYSAVRSSHVSTSLDHSWTGRYFASNWTRAAASFYYFCRSHHCTATHSTIHTSMIARAMSCDTDDGSFRSTSGKSLGGLQTEGPSGKSLGNIPLLPSVPDDDDEDGMWTRRYDFDGVKLKVRTATSTCISWLSRHAKLCCSTSYRCARHSARSFCVHSVPRFPSRPAPPILITSLPPLQVEEAFGDGLGGTVWAGSVFLARFLRCAAHSAFALPPSPPRTSLPHITASAVCTASLHSAA